MNIKTFFLLAYVFAYVFSEYILGNSCTSKYIINGTKLIYDPYSDFNNAFNGPSSCASLRSTYNTACCYLKIKFKNKMANEKYTHTGCIEVTSSEWENVDNVVNRIKSNITSSDSNLEAKKVSIDCNSSYIKLAGLFIFALLL